MNKLVVSHNAFKKLNKVKQCRHNDKVACMEDMDKLSQNTYGQSFWKSVVLSIFICKKYGQSI